MAAPGLARGALVLLLLLLLSGCLPQPAGLEQVAQEQAQARARALKLAAEAYERGLKRYEAGEWEQAIREFEIAQAYDRSDPRYPEMVLKAREQRGAVPPGHTRLVYKFTEGDSWSYRTTTTLSGELVARTGDKVSAPTQLNGRFAATLYERVLRAGPNGSGEVETRVTDVEASGGADFVQVPWSTPDLVVTYEIGRNGSARTLQVKGGDTGVPAVVGLPPDRPVFPSRPLKPGDGWNESEGQSFRGSGARQERFQFVGLEPARGEQVARITGTTQESFLQSFGPRGDLKGRVEVRWEALFDLARGRIVELAGQGKLEYGWRGSAGQDWQATLDLVTTLVLGE